jgi:hypothetical protein
MFEALTLTPAQFGWQKFLLPIELATRCHALSIFEVTEISPPQTVNLIRKSESRDRLQNFRCSVAADLRQPLGRQYHQPSVHG